MGKTTPPLAGGDVHVWTVALDVAPADLERLGASLADDESRHAARFRSARDAARYVAGRGTLRALLGSYLDAPPARLRFSYGPHGRPALAAAAAGLHFNVAHADGLALIAVTRAAPVGVDLEAIAPTLDLEAVAATHFSTEERRQLAALPAGGRVRAFFTAWTRKEAYLKALGDGLASPLGSFAVTMLQGEPARLLHIDGDPGAAAAWTLVHLEPAAGYVGAVAARAPVEARCFQWEPPV